MRQPIWQRLSLLLGLVLLIIGISVTALANPNDYPEYAQQQVSKDITVAFIKAEVVKQRLDDGTPQTLVDVRKSQSFQTGHLPNAVSMPLRQFPERYVELPRDIPVVLY